MKNKIELKKKDKIIIASHNKGKVTEINFLLKPLKLITIAISNYSNIEPLENGSTFEENALIKAYHANRLTGLNSLSDDSGLCIEALNGDPGVLSARWAGKEKNFIKAMDKIKEKLLNEKNTKAYFTCSLALVTKNKEAFCFTGKIHGRLRFPPKGNNGFGYDPIFIPKNYKKSFGEMASIEKDKISHRTIAFNKLKEAIIVK
tara:strand:+ start:11448 stop:12056 length:609 start_codon:yes stop_codon:yes gene_type:complete